MPRSTRRSASGTGMFGVEGTGDTSGYGGLVAPGRDAGSGAAALRRLVRRGGRRARGAAARPPIWSAPSSAWSSTAARSPSTCAARTCPSSPRCCATTSGCASSSAAGVSGVHYPEDAGRELHAVYHLLSMTHNRRIRLEVDCPDADPHIPSLVSDLPDQRLARARDLRHVRHHLRRSPRADPDPDARRLAGPPAAQGLPAWAASPSSTRAAPSRRRTSGGPTTDGFDKLDRSRPPARPAAPRTSTPRRGRPRRAGSSPSPARTGTRSPTARRRTSRSASSSTWVRSTPRPTACSG